MRRLSLAAAALLLAACSKTPEPDPSPEPPRPATRSTAAGATGTAAQPPPAAKGPSEVTWDAPAGWQKSDNPSPMRKATYKIPKAGADPEDAELSVSQAGGTVDMNIQRWAGQFQGKPEPKRTKKKVGDLEVTLVEIHGTFAGSGMPGAPAGAPKEGWALLGAIVETATPTFFKLTGPEKTVMAAKGDFEKLVDNLRAK